MKKLVSEINEEISVQISEHISVELSERITVDFGDAINVEFSEQINGISNGTFRVEIRGAKVRPLPIPTSYLKGTCQSFENLF